jgi:hypothetical protein
MVSHHGYSDFPYLLQKLLATLFLLFIPILILGMFIRIDLILPLTFAVLMSAIIGTLQFHMFPSVELTDGGVRIPFFFKKKFIPWSDIVEISSSRFMGRHLIVVNCRRITFFHWVYGLIYGGTLLYPSFLVSSRIDNFDTLMREIKAAIGHNSVY